MPTASPADTPLPPGAVLNAGLLHSAAAEIERNGHGSRYCAVLAGQLREAAALLEVAGR